jgi:hypothetical protein
MTNRQCQSAITNRQCQSSIRNPNRQSAIPNPVNRQSAVGNRQLLGLAMAGVLPAEPAVLAELQPLACFLFVLGRAVVAALTFGARQSNDVSHDQIRLKAYDSGLMPAQGLSRPAGSQPEP